MADVKAHRDKAKKRRHEIAAVAEIPPGTRKIVQIHRRSVGVFNVNGEFYAIRNSCPHQGGPLCLGFLSGTMVESRPGEYEYGRDGQIIRCPWHGWEFDIVTGRAMVDADRVRVKSYEVKIERPSVETYRIGVEQGIVVLYV